MQGDLPSPLGGPVGDGIWRLERFEWHQSAAVRQRQLELNIAQDRVEIAERVEQVDGMSGSVSTTAVTATLTLGSRGQLALQQTCPRLAQLPFDGYTATADVLTLIDSTARRVAYLARP